MSKLSTKNLTLKVRTLSDADELFIIYSEPEVTKYIGGVVTDRDQIVKAIFTSDTHWRKNGFGLWSVFLTKKKTLIGTCGLRKIIQTGETEILIHLSKNHWRQGYASECGNAVLKYAFEMHKLEKVVATVDKENIASIHLLEKLGFKKDGNCYSLYRVDYI